MRRILLHSCCGPCTLYPLMALRAQEWSVHGFFYNPHIQPYLEFQKRLDVLQSLAKQEGLHLIVRGDYDLERFLRNVAFREQDRCLYCYSLRIEATARLASKSRFDAFSTTLLYSKHQKHGLIASIGTTAAKKYGVPFHYEDFRVGWKEGQERARSLNLYRQQYCGCIYSEWERFAPSKGHHPTDAPEE
ncbi:MAG: epoxyqueuosine reductase QueH [Syntrophobacteraceae bacterium]|nr:epoxyqueuosine reductase QueH [Syntrophobacteraceae bacterium]